MEAIDNTMWQEFADQAGASRDQLAKFQAYEAYLSERNQDFNLTAITKPKNILRHHFLDSLVLGKFEDMSACKTIADIGTGAGFPSIPLKIMYPHVKMILIEVNNKKQQFLKDVIAILGLEDIEVCPYDWRTFLRTIECDIDFFVTRASLSDEELCRAFKPGCRYKHAGIVYWASKEWEAHPRAAQFVTRVESYKIAQKSRKLVFFSLPK